MPLRHPKRILKHRSKGVQPDKYRHYCTTAQEQAQAARFLLKSKDGALHTEMTLESA